MNKHILEGHLPPAVLSERLLQQLREIFGSAGAHVWEAVVGTGGDRLGNDQERPTMIVTEWPALIELLRQIPYIDSLNITAEVTDVGIIAIAYRNYPPAGGSFVVTGANEEWAKQMAAAVEQLFNNDVDEKTSRLYNRWIFASIQTAIPMMISFFVTLILAVLIVPNSVTRSDYIWWITAATLMATLWLANIISNRLILRVLNQYPYLRWQ